MKVFDNDHEALAAELVPLCHPWRAMMIGIDGADGAGKSWLGRFLAWRLGMPLVQQDLFMTERALPDLHFGCLEYALRRRLSHPRCPGPVIMEGVFLLATCEKLGLEPEVLVVVQRDPPNDTSALAPRLEAYRKKYRPVERARFIFKRQDDWLFGKAGGRLRR